jgi:hypothetical protein
MKQGNLRRLERIESAPGAAPQKHLIWDDGQDHGAIEAEIAAMIASGRAKESDRFMTVGWLAGEK